MRLKRLELHGYKTFASKTAFEFPTGITAIVGPNGSGKSNVADSVRWVLGEQAFGLMRGKRTDDMIFAGTELRARMGMAQATITLDNADGSLPIDFSEVTITRRAYRSGENEYLLNGQRVRLRDINELLSKVGLSERTYAVIGQGLIDTALSLKPDERRAIIEEAAGLTLYHSKRDDTLRRLDQTARNLERVQDILAEIVPRMKSLERQAKRALEAQQVQADLDALLRTWYGYHWARVKTSLRAARTLQAERAAILATRQAARDALDREMATVRAEAGDLRARLGDLHRQASDLHQRAEGLQRDLAVREERVRALRAQREELLGELATLDHERTTQIERTALARAEFTRLSDEARTKTQDSAQARAALVDRESERVRLTQQAEQLRREAQRWATDAASRRARAAEWTTRADGLDADAENARDALSERELELEALRAAIGTAEAHLSTLSARAAELAAMRQDGEDHLAHVEGVLRECAARVAQTEADEGRLHDRHLMLQNMRQAFEGTAAGARAVLQAARAGRVQGVLGPLAELIHVPVRFERAVEAVLGADLDALVVEAWASAEAALAVGGGTVTLLSLPLLRPQRPLVATQVPFVLGNLAALLMQESANVPHERLIYTLFGRVLVTATREDALRLVRHLPADSRAITLTGECVTHTGVFTAAQPGTASGEAHEGGVRLAREREWRALPGLLTEAAEQRRAAGTELAEQERLRAEWRTTLQDVAQSAAAIAAEQRQAEQQVQTQHRATDRLAHTLEVERQRLARQAQEASDLRGRASLLAVEAETFEHRVEQAEENRQEAQGLLAALAEGMDVVTARVTQAERAAAVLAEAQRRQNETLRAQEQALAQLDQRLQTRTQRATELEHEAERLATTNVALRDQEVALSVQIDALAEQILPAEARLQVLEAEQTRVEQAEAEARTRLNTAEAAANQAQLDLALRQDELDTLRRHIHEDLGLVELDYDDDISGQEPLPLNSVVTRLPDVAELPLDLENAVTEKRAQVRRLGAINPDAPVEYAEVFERHGFLTTQVADLGKAMTDLQQVIGELDELTKREFKKTFDAVNTEFKEMFVQLFGGGAARLELSDPEDLVHTGIDVVARPPGKRQQPLALLSGGERALTAGALIFALLRVSPPPFCILDEVDAALDESNVVRFRDMVMAFQKQTQFIVITHNRGTMHAADTFYGITMGADGSSAAYSVRLVGDQLVQANPDPKLPSPSST